MEGYSGQRRTEKDTLNLELFKARCETDADGLLKSYHTILDTISNLCQQLVRVERQRTQKVHYAQRAQSLLDSPLNLRALPTEIISEIFIRCLPDHPYPNRRQAPLVLCEVDSFWRQVAINTPALWTSLWLPGRPGIQPLYPVPINTGNLTKYWLSRAGALPLSLFFFSGDPSAIVGLSTLLTSISVAPQVGSLSVYSPFPYWLSRALPNTLTNLKRLTLDVKLIPTFPNLPFNLDQLEFLSMPGSTHHASISAWRRIFQQCGSVQQGEFSLSGNWGEQDDLPLPADAKVYTAFPNLRSLSLNVMGPSSLATILQGYSLPALSTLKIFGTWPHLHWYSVEQFIKPPSFFRLQELVLWNVAITIHDLILLISNNSRLHTLHLNIYLDAADTTTLLQTLTFSTDSARRYAPVLRTLHLGVDPEDAPSMLPLINDLVSSRWTLASCDSGESPSLMFYIHLVSPNRRPTSPRLVADMSESVEKEMQSSARPNASRYVRAIAGYGKFHIT